MKKIFIFILLALLVAILTGFLGPNRKIDRLINEGNKFYRNHNYKQATKSYQQGLQLNSTNTKLKYNLANGYYQLKEYKQAIKYYNQTQASADKYLNLGNCYKLLADQSNKLNNKIKKYQQVLQQYKVGIKSYPASQKLKFNYEYVKELLDKLKQQKKQKKQRQQNKKQQQKEQTKQGQQQQPNQSQKKKEEQSPQQNKSKPKQEGSSSSKEKTETKDKKSANQKALQILKALEQKEKNSLKNNQKIKSGSGTGSKYNW